MQRRGLGAAHQGRDVTAGAPDARVALTPCSSDLHRPFRRGRLLVGRRPHPCSDADPAHELRDIDRGSDSHHHTHPNTSGTADRQPGEARRRPKSRG